MKSKFALSFGIALIFIGIINFFLETNNIILFGISLSAFIFSIISILFATMIDEEKCEFLNIIPLIVLLCFLCYGNELMKIDIIKYIVNSKLTSSLTFISFGLSFASEYIIENKFKLVERIKHLSLANEMIDYTCLLILIENKYLKECVNKKVIIDDSCKAFLRELENLLKEKEKESRIIVELLSKDKDIYSIDDFKSIYINNTDILNYKKIKTNQNKKIKYKKNKRVKK